MQLAPADNSDAEAVRLQGKYFRVTRIGGLPLGLGMIGVVRLNSTWDSHVFREQDLRLSTFEERDAAFDDLPF